MVRTNFKFLIGRFFIVREKLGTWGQVKESLCWEQESETRQNDAVRWQAVNW